MVTDFWSLFLGFADGSKSTAYKINHALKKRNVNKLYDFQHPKEYFDDYKENLVLRVLDSRIQVFHDQKGLHYFPTKYLTNDKIKKAQFKLLNIWHQNWTIQPIEIKSGTIKIKLGILL